MGLSLSKLESSEADEIVKFKAVYGCFMVLASNVALFSFLTPWFIGLIDWSSLAKVKL